MISHSSGNAGNRLCQFHFARFACSASNNPRSITLRWTDHANTDHNTIQARIRIRHLGHNFTLFGASGQAEIELLCPGVGRRSFNASRSGLMSG